MYKAVIFGGKENLQRQRHYKNLIYSCQKQGKSEKQTSSQIFYNLGKYPDAIKPFLNYTELLRSCPLSLWSQCSFALCYFFLRLLSLSQVYVLLCNACTSQKYWVDRFCTSCVSAISGISGISAILPQAVLSGSCHVS